MSPPNTRSRNYLILFAIGVMPFMVNGWINAQIYKDVFAYWGFELFSWVILPCLLFGYAIQKLGLRLPELGIHGKLAGEHNPSKVIMFCLLFAMLTYPFYKGAFHLSAVIFPAHSLFNYESMQPDNGFLRQMIAVYFALSAGIVEELYYRGLFHKISTFFARPALVYLTASPLFFALSHWEGGMQNIMAAWIYGIAAAAIFLRMKNLWPLIAGHIVTDYVWFS